jgi:hypothetical protein
MVGCERRHLYSTQFSPWGQIRDNLVADLVFVVLAYMSGEVEPVVWVDGASDEQMVGVESPPSHFFAFGEAVAATATPSLAAPPRLGGVARFPLGGRGNVLLHKLAQLQSTPYNNGCLYNVAIPFILT